MGIIIRGGKRKKPVPKIKVPPSNNLLDYQKDDKTKRATPMTHPILGWTKFLKTENNEYYSNRPETWLE